MAMLSYSNFGSDTEGSPAKVHEAVAYMQKEYPELAIDGEMQVKFAHEPRFARRANIRLPASKEKK